MKNAIEVRNLEKYYATKELTTKILKDISFEIAEGEFVAIMGASGSGKTTLLNCLSTIDTPTNGQILLNGEDITKMKTHKLEKLRKKEIGYIFQDFSLISTLNAYDNIALSLLIADQKNMDNIQTIAELLDIESCLDKYVNQLSGGQQQRIAAARALVKNPKILFADEPTGAIDSKAAKKLLKKFKEINQKLKTTILMVTHDNFSASYANQIIFIKDGEIFNKLIKEENESNTEFLEKIIAVQKLLNGEKDV